MSSNNWANKKVAPPTIRTGLDLIPTPIVDHLRKALGDSRKDYQHIYHVTELLYCLRKAYYSRTTTKPKEFGIDSLWNIYRGSTFDALWSPLFKVNQENYIVARENDEGRSITLTGTLDFVWVDEDNLEPILYDLKIPKNIYFKKKFGAGKFYIEQVQTYLGMAHELGQLPNVHRCRVMMLADDCVIEEIPEKDEMLDYIFNRGFLLDKALEEENPDGLLCGPEEKWECDKKYCPGDVEWRVNCKNHPIIP